MNQQRSWWLLMRTTGNSQFSGFRLGTREKRLPLFVKRMRIEAWAWPAIMVSIFDLRRLLLQDGSSSCRNRSATLAEGDQDASATMTSPSAGRLTRCFGSRFAAR